MQFQMNYPTATIILFIFKIFELSQFKSSRTYEYMKIKYERELRGEELYELY